jgi:PAS domain S-box-containing protein
MNPSLLPAHEAERVRLLQELRLADGGSEPSFDALARLTAAQTASPMAGMSVVDAQQQWFKACVGMADAEMPRHQSFCTHTIQSDDLLVVHNTLEDPRFAGNPLVSGGLRVRFYAGAPIVVEGKRIGTVCCLDQHERRLDAAAERSLRDLASLAASLLEQRLAMQRLSARAGVPEDADGEPIALAEERWRLAVEGGGQGVWDWDAGKRGLYFSDAWKAIIGHAGHEIGTHLKEWLSRIHPDDLRDAKAKLIAHLRGETPVYVVEHRMRHKNGHDVWVLNSGRVVRRARSGRALRMVGTLIDVTSQRVAVDSQRDKRAAELAHVAKSEFLSRMSHEMRTPLNAVIGFTQLLLSRQGPPDAAEVRDYAEHVLRAGEHLLAMTNDVLDLQHVEEGRVALEVVDVPLDGIVSQVMLLLADAARAQGVQFDSHVPAGVAVRADEHRLRQVLLNIASNAVKYNRPAGAVRWSVDAESRPGRVRLSIEDTGSGLKPAQLERLFQPFERLGRETSTIEGTGLGLIIARSLVEAMGGSIEVASRAGEGTRVVVELAMAQQTALPFADAPAVAPPTLLAPMPAIEPPAPAPALRLLYVEDNRINAILFEEALRLREGIELRVAEDGAEALDQVRSWKPDVLVLDAHLPGMDGFELLGALRREPGLEDVPAFMCSADAMPDDVRRAAAAGFAGYWSKPINLARIMSDLDRLSAGLPPSVDGA